MDNILNEQVKNFVKETLRELKKYRKTSQMQERCRLAIKRAILNKHNDILRILYCQAVKACIREANGKNFSLSNVEVVAQNIYADSGIDDLE